MSRKTMWTLKPQTLLEYAQVAVENMPSSAHAYIIHEAEIIPEVKALPDDAKFGFFPFVEENQMVSLRIQFFPENAEFFEVLMGYFELKREGAATKVSIVPLTPVIVPISQSFTEIVEATVDA